MKRNHGSNGFPWISVARRLATDNKVHDNTASTLTHTPEKGTGKSDLKSTSGQHSRMYVEEVVVVEACTEQ